MVGEFLGSVGLPCLAPSQRVSTTAISLYWAQVELVLLAEGGHHKPHYYRTFARGLTSLGAPGQHPWSHLTLADCSLLPGRPLCLALSTCLEVQGGPEGQQESLAGA